jgi:hypothetical protein
MPRGSKPGERRGGRQRGPPNKKTALRNAAIAKVAANPDLTPLDFLRGVMRDPNASPDVRIKAAQAAAPYIHAKPRRGSHPGDPADGSLLAETGAFTIDTAVAKALRDDHERLNYLVRKEAAPREYGGPLSAEADEESRLRRSIAEKARAIGCPAGYGSREARRDGNRLHQLNCKRISPGGRLTGAEDIEEARLVARVAAFDESPEGCARRRIFELILEDFGRRGLSAAQQNELHRLQTLYPDQPDPDDPLKDVLEALGKAMAAR